MVSIVENRQAFCLSITAPPDPLSEEREKTSAMVEKQVRGRVEIYAPKDLSSLEKQVAASMDAALCDIRNLCKARIEAKLSVSRIKGVARELRELIKVLSKYGC